MPKKQTVNMGRREKEEERQRETQEVFVLNTDRGI
jgi:hypothetical protein